MANVFLYCSEKTRTIIQDYLFAHDIFLSNTYDENSIIIYEMTSETYNQNLKNFKENNLIFVINKETPIFDLLDYKPLGFIRIEEINADLERIKDWIDERKKILKFHSSSNTLYIAPNQIIYIESYLHYLYIHTENSSFKIRKKISEILEELKPYHFIQIHRSYIVNEHYIEAMEKECLLTNGTTLPIGNKYKKSHLK